MNWLSNRKFILVCAAIILTAFAVELWPSGKSCCKRKQHETSTVTLRRVDNRDNDHRRRPEPNPNCQHGMMMREMRRQGRLAFFAKAHANWLASLVGFTPSGPTIPPGAWDYLPCTCPEACIW